LFSTVVGFFLFFGFGFQKKTIVNYLMGLGFRGQELVSVRILPFGFQKIRFPFNRFAKGVQKDSLQINETSTRKAVLFVACTSLGPPAT
jgi:hypothetical protein